MFSGCSSLTMLPSSFNLPAGIRTVGTNFCNYMFSGCSSLTLLPSSFNLPAGITTVGNTFCSGMFSGCSSLTSLSNNFNLPAGITTVGTSFCSGMFESCSSLGALLSSFNLPAGITTVGSGFCSGMFSGCSHDNFKVNAAFKFPRLSQSEINKSNVFYRTFYCNANKTYPRQTVSAASIINGNPVPSSTRGTFTSYNATQSANRWSDYNSLNANWQ